MTLFPNSPVLSSTNFQGEEGLKAGKRGRIFSVTFPSDEGIWVMD